MKRVSNSAGWARRRRSAAPLVLFTVAVGCTAIIDGSDPSLRELEPVAHGSQPGRGDPPIQAGQTSLVGSGGVDTGGGAGESPAAAGDGGAVEPSSAGASGAGHGGAAAAGAPADAGAPSGGAAVTSGGSTGSSGGVGGASLGGSSSAGSAGASGSAGANGGDVITWSGPLPAGDYTRGLLLVFNMGCRRCHGEDLAGRGFYRNITPDLETGVGSWTDREIANSVRGGSGPNGASCSTMPLYPALKDQQIADVITYLRSVAPVSNLVTAVCPGHVE